MRKVTALLIAAATMLIAVPTAWSCAGGVGPDSFGNQHHFTGTVVGGSPTGDVSAQQEVEVLSFASATQNDEEFVLSVLKLKTTGYWVQDGYVYKDDGAGPHFFVGWAINNQYYESIGPALTLPYTGTFKIHTNGCSNTFYMNGVQQLGAISMCGPWYQYQAFTEMITKPANKCIVENSYDRNISFNYQGYADDFPYYFGNLSLNWFDSFGPYNGYSAIRAITSFGSPAFQVHGKAIKVPWPPHNV